MGTLTVLLSLAITASGCFLAACSLYLFGLSLASSFASHSTPQLRHVSRLVVLVPAYNEAELVGRCVHSLRQQCYPADCYEVIVIADNCTDNTAAVALASGAQVLERTEPDARGKGRALRWAMDRILDERTEHDSSLPDGFVVVDADSVAGDSLLAHLAGQLESGADAVQAEYLVLDDASSSRVRLRAVAFFLFHRVRFSGRAALHLPCNLVGNGFLLSRRLVERHPWNAFTAAEDLEYSVNLRLNGVRPVFCSDAVVFGPVPTSRSASQAQRERWEGGRLYVIKRSLPGLLREILRRSRNPVLDLVLDLMVPPLGLIVVGSVIGSALSIALGISHDSPMWLLAPWAVSFVGTVGFVVIGLLACRAPMWMFRALLYAPSFLLHKALGTLGVLRSNPATTWVRTERSSEVA